MSLATPLKRSASAINPAVWNSQGSEDDEQGNNEEQNKKPKYSWYVTLENESPDGTSEDESDNESIYSVQDQETEYARDTSDTSTSTWISTSHRDMSVQVEYEVASMSESDDHPFLDSLSTSDPEEMPSQRVYIELNESRLDLADDSDDSRTTTSIDSEIGRADYWTCVQCNMKKNSPLYRYCEKCFQLRKNFYPPRPRRKRKRTTKVDELKAEDKSSSQNASSQESSQNSQEMSLTRGDSGLGSSQDSQAISEFDCEPATSSCTPLRNSSQCSTSQSQESDVDFAESKIDSLRKKAIEDPDNKYCLMCTLRPKDGAFAHGSNLHICCCYKCAVKTWKTTKYCPICNRKVTNVFKVFMV